MPGARAPRASAPSIIASAMRSLYEPVGLKNSSLTRISAAPFGTTRRSLTTGVRPMDCRTESTVVAIDMGPRYHTACAAADAPRDLSDRQRPLARHGFQYLPALGGEHLPEKLGRSEADPGA